VLIEAHGLKSRPMPIDFRQLLNEPELQDALNSFTGKIRAWRATRTLMTQLHDAMLDAAQTLSPDALIAHPKAYLANMIARYLGIPSIPTTLQPAFAPTRAFPQFLFPVSTLGPWGNRLSHHLFGRLTQWGQRKLVGDWAATRLGTDFAEVRPFFEGHSPGGQAVPHLHGYSRHIIPKPPDWGESERITGYWFLDRQTDYSPPDDLARFLENGEPPVYVGFGSMPAQDARQKTERVVEALTRAKRRGVLATGWGGLGQAEARPYIHMLDHAPHDWLFPRCAAVVHHGGAGTTHEGLRWGRPTVICPLTVDQPFWGRRVAELGVGAKPVPLKKLTADKLATAMSRALAPEVAQAAEAMGAAIRSEDGAETAATIIDRFLNGAHRDRYPFESTAADSSPSAKSPQSA